MSEKIYIGKGKVTGQYNRLKISICLTDVPKEHISISKGNGKKYLNIEIGEMKQADKYGNTHTVTVDTWKPEAKPEEQTPESVPPISDDLPF